MLTGNSNMKLHEKKVAGEKWENYLQVTPKKNNKKTQFEVKTLFPHGSWRSWRSWRSWATMGKCEGVFSEELSKRPRRVSRRWVLPEPASV